MAPPRKRAAEVEKEGENARKARRLMHRLSIRQDSHPPYRSSPSPEEKQDICMKTRSSYNKDEHTVVVTSLSDSEDDIQEREQAKAFSIIDRLNKIPAGVLHSAPPATDLVLWKPQESWSLLPAETFKSFIGQSTSHKPEEKRDKAVPEDLDAMDLDI